MEEVMVAWRSWIKANMEDVGSGCLEEEEALGDMLGGVLAV
jgi:hypothetical protein